MAFGKLCQRIGLTTDEEVNNNLHFAGENNNGFNPEAVLRVCDTFSFIKKISETLTALQ